MRSPFVRPFFATFFYGLAILSVVVMVLLVIVLVIGGAALGGPVFAAAGTAYGMFLIPASVIGGTVYAAIGYVIEKIAKIEWNTRPDDETGLNYTPPGTTAPVSTKRYFYIANGPLHGPFQAPEILDLYRSGKVPNNARLYVEEGGNRRPLANWSEIGV